MRRFVSEAGLPFRDDPTNAEPAYARNRIRNEVLPVLGEIGPEAEATIAETQAELAEEGEALERVAADALAESGADAAGAIGRDALASLDPAIRRLALRRLAERAAAGAVPLGRRRADQIWRLVNEPEGGVVELGGGVEAQIEGDTSASRPVRLPSRRRRLCRCPAAAASAAGRCARSSPRACRPADGPDLAVLDPVRSAAAWSCGPGATATGCGRSGSTAASPSRTFSPTARFRGSLRHALPVVTSDGRIVWIAGRRGLRGVRRAGRRLGVRRS